MAEMMSEKELAEIRALADRATPAPWRNGADPSHFGSPEVTDDKTFAYYITTDKDAAFVAVSRSAVPRLLDLVDALQRTVKFLRYYEIPDDAIKTLTDELTAKAAGTPLEAWAEDAATNIDQLRRERDEWRDLASRMRPVIEAACAYVDAARSPTNLSPTLYNEIAAPVDVYRKATP